MNDWAVRVVDLGKRYRKSTWLQGKLIEWIRRGGRADHFWALRHLTFDVARGGMFGIVGPNGAGKSTLLRILSRITRPNEGEARIRGRVGSLLAVGTGFHPELTGRENVFLNGALIGMRNADIKKQFDEIVDFSGVEEFLDMPLKRYSSGMKVRLGFAVAVNLQQEIMLVDEVLSVGDAAFRERCLAKMEEVTRVGRTVVFVGHNMAMVGSACDRAIWIDKGTLLAEGKAGEVVSAYQEATAAARTSEDGFFDLTGRPELKGGEPILITHLRLLNAGGEPVSTFPTGGNVKVAIGYRIVDRVNPSDISVGVTILGRGQFSLAFCENLTVGDVFRDLPEEGEFVCAIHRLPLMPGGYKLAVRCKIGTRLVHMIANAGELQVRDGEYYPSGLLPPPGSGNTLFDHRWSARAADEGR
ncbi:MAG: ABC transporter ATP-binding protein [Candidatus Eisenbacteria bacterium]